MKKIGLILANPITNYGAHLQAFATQYVVDKLGVTTEVMDVSKTNESYHYKIDFGFFVYALKKISNKLFGKKHGFSYDEAYYSNVKERTAIAADFRKRRLHDEHIYLTYEELASRAKDLDGVIIGSDQMWLPGSSFSSINSLNFVPKGVKRLSYATSLGVEKYPKYCWNSARQMWERMDFVSVREKQGADIIKKVCKNKVDVKVVVDPTYLLTKEQWEILIPIEKMSEDKYVFCYFLGNNEESKLCAKRYAETHNLKLVSILSSESFSPIDRSYADVTLGAISPETFINWIRGAECVFTDSFHGLAFSVINQKQFFVFYRHKKDPRVSKNSRIDNILKTWNIPDRLLTNPNVDWNIETPVPINYLEVDKVMIEERESSLAYLKTMLGVNEN